MDKDKPSKGYKDGYLKGYNDGKDKRIKELEGEISIKDAEYQARVESIFGEIENEGKFLHPEHIFLSGQEWQELKVKYLRKGVK